MGKYSVTQILIAVVCIAGMIAIVYVAMGVFGIAIPAWFITILWILAVVVVAVLAIKFISSLWGG
jgi:hypothetical protein